MNIQDLDIGTPLWFGLSGVAFLAAAVILAVKAADSSKRTATAAYAAAAILCLITFVGVVIVDVELRSDEKEAVIDGYAQSYGLKLDERDIRHLNDVDWKDVTRNLETADGSLKQVLFRGVDGKALPYTLDSTGTWIPMQTVGDAQ